MAEAIYEDIERRRISSGYDPVFPPTLQQTTYHLETFKHLHKLLYSVNTKLNSIYNMAAAEMNSLANTAHKKLADIMKESKVLPNTSTFATFIEHYLDEIEKQSKLFKNLNENTQNDFLKPLSEETLNRRKMWGACLEHATGFDQQIDKQMSNLQRCHKQCSDAVQKVDTVSPDEKASPANQKALQIFHDLYNTCVLQRRCTETMNVVLCTEFIPHVMDNIEQNHRELNANYLHYLRSMLSLQKNAWCDLQASTVQSEAALQDVNLLEDLTIVMDTSKMEMVEKYPLGVVGFTVEKVNLPKIKTGYMLDAFIKGERARPNLQRRLNSLNAQREQLEHDIGVMKTSQKVHAQHNALTLESLNSSLNLCEREANLSITLRQKELYITTVIDFLGPAPSTGALTEDTIDGKGSITISDGPRAHIFLEPIMIKPVACAYCEKLVIVRGYVCEVCSITVHKRCSANVQFCEPGSVQKPSVRPPVVDTDDEDENIAYNDGPIYEYPSLARSLPELANVNQPSYEYADQTLISGTVNKNKSKSSYALGEQSSMRASVLVDAQLSTNKRQQSKNFLNPISSKLKGVFSKPRSSSSPPSNTLSQVQIGSTLLNNESALASEEDTNNSSPSSHTLSQMNIEGPRPKDEAVITSEGKTKTLRAKYEFIKENENEVSVKEDEVVTLIYMKDDWTMVKTEDGEGYVPTSYVESMN